MKSCLVHVPETERHVSLPIRGAWIEILSFTVAASSPCGRSPSGERGLKYLLRNLHHRNGGRSPSGERGLKCVGHGHLAHVVLSLPIRGAWIERNVCATTRRPSPGSLPIRGAWIDISRTCGTASAPPCRSPSGERGLKLHGRHALDGQRQVAPHLGSVGSYAGLIRWLMSVSSHLSLI